MKTTVSALTLVIALQANVLAEEKKEVKKEETAKKEGSSKKCKTERVCKYWDLDLPGKCIFCKNETTCE